jgi:hypothetical protein
MNKIKIPTESLENDDISTINLGGRDRKCDFFEKILQKNLQIKIFVVPLQSQNKRSGGGEMVDTLL